MGPGRSAVVHFPANRVRGMSSIKVWFCMSLSTATLFLILFGALGTIHALGSQLAFPGAEGYGKYALGGRGGDVYHVTNLNDSGAGSLRQGLVSAAGPRTIVFDVSGTIVLKGTLKIEGYSRITIAGQTAPGKGITIRENKLAFEDCNEMIVRYLRLRLGDENKAPGDYDVMEVNYCDNIILDHLSLSWGIDGNSDYRGNKRMTLQWLLYSEALNDSIHPEGTHAMCTSIRDNQGHTTVYHNIYSTSRDRHPTLGGGTGRVGYYNVILDFRNCLNYNWEGESNIGGMKINIVGNYYKPGPTSNATKPPIKIKEEDSTQAQGYMAGNVFASMPSGFTSDNYTAVTYNNTGKYMSTTRAAWEHPTEFSMGEFKPTVTQSAQSAYDVNLQYAGCSLVRDTVDVRVIQNIVNGAGQIINSQADVGGWDPYPGEQRPFDWDTDQDGMSDAWEEANGLNPHDPADRNGDRNEDGYTNLEEYLNSLVPDMTAMLSAQ